MIIDTNILLDLLVRGGANNADDFFKTQKPIIITDIVINEAVYVMLGSIYTMTKTSVIDAATRVLQLSNVTHQSFVGIHYLELYAKHSLDLADCYLIALALKTNKDLKTLDKKMLKVYQLEK